MVMSLWTRFLGAHPVVFRSNVILLESYHIYTSDRSHYSYHKVLGNEITMASTKGGELVFIGLGSVEVRSLCVVRCSVSCFARQTRPVCATSSPPCSATFLSTD